MKFIHPAMQMLSERVIAWASDDPAIRTILVVGSLVRRDHPADEWSDLDMVIYVTDLAPYRADPVWLESIGEVWVHVPYIRLDNAPEYLVLFDGGFKLDFAFEPLERLHSLIEMKQLPDYMQRGYEILLDKDELTAKLPPPIFTPAAPAKPTQAEFDETLRAFWYGVAMIAKQIRRQEWWVVKTQDAALKEYLLHMIEWHAQVTHNRDTWHGGRYMLEWADPDIVKRLPELFGGVDPASSWRALLVMIDLFRRLAIETAQLLKYPYPARLDEQITQWVNRMLDTP